MYVRTDDDWMSLRHGRVRISGRLAELCERGGVDKATVDALNSMPLDDTLRRRLRGLLTPEDCDYVGLERALKLEAGTDGRPGLRLRRLLDAWGSRAFVCRNGIIADWNITIALCIAGNAVPLIITSSVFGHVDHVLRAMTGNLDVPCGGVPILLCGDNHQK